MAVRRELPVPFRLCFYLMGSFYPISLLKTGIASDLMIITFGTVAQLRTTRVGHDLTVTSSIDWLGDTLFFNKTTSDIRVMITS